jgi:hypothetical protein
VLRNSLLLQDLYGQGRGTSYRSSVSEIFKTEQCPVLTGCEHGIEEENPTISNIGRELLVEKLRHAGLLIALDQDLSNADGPATVPQALLHSLSGSHDGDAADFALELDTQIGPTDGSSDRLLDHRKVIQSFFHQESNDSIGVENKIGTCCPLISDHPVGAFASQRSCPRSKLEKSHVKRAIS